MGQPMDYQPPMLAPTVPTMVWGGQIRLMARALGVELDEIRETVARARSRQGDHRAMGEFAAGSQGAVRFEVQGVVRANPPGHRAVTRIHPSARRTGRRRPMAMGRTG